MYRDQYEFSHMEISGQAYNSKVTVQISQDSDLREFLDACKTVAIGLTYQEASWRQTIMDLADEYRDEIELEETRRRNRASEHIFHHPV